MLLHTTLSILSSKTSNKVISISISKKYGFSTNSIRYIIFNLITNSHSMSKFLLPTALKELRFHLSQTGEASIPLRNFLANNYPSLKTQLNYKLPILIRESYGVPPSITARFEKGQEVKNNLEGLDEKGIESALQSLLKN